MRQRTPQSSLPWSFLTAAKKLLDFGSRQTTYRPAVDSGKLAARMWQPRGGRDQAKINAIKREEGPKEEIRVIRGAVDIPGAGDAGWGDFDKQSI